MGEQHVPGPAGVASLSSLGIEHWHDEEWECTYNHDQTDLLDEILVEAEDPWAPMPISTLIVGPDLFAARVPTEVVEGDVGDYEIRFFATEADAQAAIAKALGQ